MNFDFHSGENGAMKAIRAMGMATILLTVVGGAAWGGSDNRLGTNGALELRLPVDAREIAMAGADLGSVQGVQALFYNPAGVAESDSKTEVSFTHTNWIANMNINYVGVAQSIGGVGTLGLSAKVLSVGDIPFTSESAPDGNGEVFSPTFSTLGLTYARRMKPPQVSRSTSASSTTPISAVFVSACRCGISGRTPAMPAAISTG